MKRIFIVILCFSTIGFAQKKPFAIEDLYKIKSISTPQYSPDGKQIAFTVTESFLKEGNTNS